MGKNHRHKKMLKSEKAKIKMKVKSEKTKFLPKGLNETKTDFKIKPIILPEQLKQKDPLELLSNRKLNVKDILSRLRHHSVTVRHDSLQELKQLITVHLADLASQHLAQIMQGLPPLLRDENKIVRQNVMLILQKILELVDEAKIKPFFPLLSSYLRCCMTNINRPIQEDSLGFLAILLQHVPQLIADEKHKILPNLFALISKFKVEAKPMRTLSVNLNSKLTSVKWHIQVLNGIYGFLKAIDMKDNESLSSTSLTNISAYKKAARHVPLIHNSYLKSKIAFNSQLVDSVDKNDVIDANMDTLMTLLYEIWMEVAPDKDIREMNNFGTLSNDSASILSCILNVMHLLLLRLVKNNEGEDASHWREIFFTNECKSLVHNVLGSFPYARHQERVKQDNTTVTKLLGIHLNTDGKFTRENLLICFLFCNQNVRLVRASTLSDAQRILRYIEHCLVTRGAVNNMNIDCLLLVVRTILFENIEWHRKVDVETILTRFVSFYETHTNNKEASGSNLKRENQNMLGLLCDVSQLSHLSRNPIYQKWLGNISASLGAEEVTENVIDALLVVGKQNNLEFLAGLRRRMPVILSNYQKIRILNHQQGEYIARLKILCLFYYLPNLGKSEIDALMQFRLNCLEEQEKSIVEYLLQNIDSS